MLDKYLNRVICGDCLEVMKELPDNCVDLVLTDPPYGRTNLEWDIFPTESLKHLCRLAKSQIIFSDIYLMCELVQSLDNFRYEWVWDKKCVTNIVNANKMPLRCHEYILCFGDLEYTPIKTGNSGSPFGQIKKTTAIGTMSNGLDENAQSGVGYPKSIITIMRPNNLTGGGLHPTQKPVGLLKYLIQTYTNQGDTILDPFLGSGTTAVACKQLGRNFIGVEINPEYCAIAENRLRQEVLPL